MEAPKPWTRSRGGESGCEFGVEDYNLDVNLNLTWNIPVAVHFNVFPPLECQCCGVKKCGIHLLHTPDPTSMEDPSTCFNCNEED